MGQQLVDKGSAAADARAARIDLVPRAPGTVIRPPQARGLPFKASLPARLPGHECAELADRREWSLEQEVVPGRQVDLRAFASLRRECRAGVKTRRGTWRRLMILMPRNDAGDRAGEEPPPVPEAKPPVLRARVPSKHRRETVENLARNLPLARRVRPRTIALGSAARRAPRGPETTRRQARALAAKRRPLATAPDRLPTSQQDEESERMPPDRSARSFPPPHARGRSRQASRPVKRPSPGSGAAQIRTSRQAVSSLR